MTPVDLVTPRLLLRAPGEALIDAIAEACTDPAIARYTTVPSPYRRSDAEGFVRDHVPTVWDRGSGCVWAIRAASEPDALLGMIGLESIADGSAELGFWLAAAARGRGYIDEAVAAVLDFGFSADGLQLQRVQWRAVPGNVPSARVARRAGFSYEGLSRLGGVHRGTRVDLWVAGLLATDPRGPRDGGWPSDSFDP
ncbi:GNAT family N-acetyltransferase [Planctomonas deserti]|uniref:GNAT family N-acetyltransferase n=1 Tax=Planctomonas deserti TaxID=2144185 RepID=UPI000D3644C6|nr:GNAT family protein [Planctomonas deserti]